MHNIVQANATRTVNNTLNTIVFFDDVLVGRAIKLAVKRSVDDQVIVLVPL